MNNLEIRKKYLETNNLSLSDLTVADGSTMMETWSEHNPMPETDQNDIDKIKAKAFWSLEHEVAMWFFIGEEYPTSISTCRWMCNRRKA